MALRVAFAEQVANSLNLLKQDAATKIQRTDKNTILKK